MSSDEKLFPQYPTSLYYSQQTDTKLSTFFSVASNLETSSCGIFLFFFISLRFLLWSGKLKVKLHGRYLFSILFVISFVLFADFVDHSTIFFSRVNIRHGEKDSEVLHTIISNTMHVLKQCWWNSKWWQLQLCNKKESTKSKFCWTSSLELTSTLIQLFINNCGNCEN